MKSQCHTGMKLAPVRVFTCKHPLTRLYLGDLHSPIERRGYQRYHTDRIDSETSGKLRDFTCGDFDKMVFAERVEKHDRLSPHCPVILRVCRLPVCAD